MNKRLEYITELIETYGLEQILCDAELTLPQVLDLLDELGYLYLEQYEGEVNADSRPD